MIQVQVGEIQNGEEKITKVDEQKDINQLVLLIDLRSVIEQAQQKEDNEKEEDFYGIVNDGCTFEILKQLLELGASLQQNKLVCANFNFSKLMVDPNWKLNDISSMKDGFSIHKDFLISIDDSESIFKQTLNENINDIFGMISQNYLFEENIFYALILIFICIIENSFSLNIKRDDRKNRIIEYFENSQFNIISNYCQSDIFSLKIAYFELFGCDPKQNKQIDQIGQKQSILEMYHFEYNENSRDYCRMFSTLPEKESKRGEGQEDDDDDDEDDTYFRMDKIFPHLEVGNLSKEEIEKMNQGNE